MQKCPIKAVFYNLYLFFIQLICFDNVNMLLYGDIMNTLLNFKHFSINLSLPKT